MKKAIKGKVGFAIGTGRCGTHFIAEILKNEKSIAIYHERYPLLESFERFVQWYNLPIDHEGFLNTLETEIKKDLIHKNFYFESSSYLSFSIEELYKRFDAKFIFLVRAPHEVINSYITKGLYKFPYIQKDYEKALGYQKSEKFHHYFSRLAPKGQEFFEWNHKTRVGKLAWFWREFNKEVLKRLKNIPESNWKLIKIEEFDYATYRSIVSFLGIHSTLDEENFNKIAKKKPGKMKRKYSVDNWSKKEIEQYEEYVKPVADLFGYKFKLKEILL